jgi:hypothetical protein
MRVHGIDLSFPNCLAVTCRFLQRRYRYSNAIIRHRQYVQAKLLG